MSGGMAMFQSELRSAVRDTREAPAPQATAKAVPKRTPSAGSTAAASVVSGAATKTPFRPARLHPDAGRKPTVVRLWLPLTPLWILLAPFALLLAPVLLFVPATRGIPPYRTALALGATLIALSGTVVAVDSRDAIIRIRIF